MAGPILTRVAALSLFDGISRPAFGLVEGWCPVPPQMDWRSFTLTLREASIADALGEDRFTLRERWLPTVGRELENLGGEVAVRTRLLDAWMDAPSVELLDTMVGWAASMSRWEAMERIWILLAERTDGISQATLRHFAAMPEEARHAYPILTWASGASASLLGHGSREGLGALWSRLMADSAMLHGDWAVRKDTDEAVTAGTFRMIGERRMTASQAGGSLDAAWRTKAAVDELIDARARIGEGPSRMSQAVFRAFSARLALFRGDPRAAVNEARWSNVLGDWEPLTIMAKGIEALALAIANEDGPERHSDPRAVSVCEGLGARGLRGMGEVYEILAYGYEAVRRLDRAVVDRCLEAATREAATVAGVWAVRVSLQAWRTALWGDLSTGMHAFSGEIARLSTEGREDTEPMGADLLGRAHAFLLAKSGAFQSAVEVAETLPEAVKLVSMARTHLWAGQYRQASRLADLGPHKPGLDVAQRYRLASIRIAVAALEADPAPELRREVAREVARILQTGSHLYLALIPLAARSIVLDLAGEELGADHPGLASLRERLAELNDHGWAATRPIHLTERERVLLPLLATSSAVPAIANQLTVSPNTIRKQVVTLRGKFGATSREEMIRRARTAGLLD